MFTCAIPYFDAAAIAGSGQCFRMDADGDGWSLIAAGRRLRVAPAGAGRWRFSCSRAAFEGFWRGYFDLDTDYGAFQRALETADPFLRAAAERGSGVRILRQEPFETLICFLLSQRKSIPAIRTAVRALCARFGAPLRGGGSAFPTPAALAAAGEDALRACGLGYRAPYVAEAARRAACGALDFGALAALPDDGLEAVLRTLPGVGPKVAACVMLFGFHRLRAFPRDVWMNRAAALCGGDFALCGCGGFEGVVQQYIFCYARAERAFLFGKEGV